MRCRPSSGLTRCLLQLYILLKISLNQPPPSGAVIYWIMNETEKILNEHLRHAVLSASEEVAEEARMHHRFKPNKGKLELAITKKVSTDGLTAWVTIDRTQAPYGPFVHEGSRPHVIRPTRKKRSLRWPKPQGWATPKGNFVFAKKVNHPGTEADPFLYNALDAESAEVEKIFSRHVGFALEEIENACGD